MTDPSPSPAPADGIRLRIVSRRATRVAGERIVQPGYVLLHGIVRDEIDFSHLARRLGWSDWSVEIEPAKPADPAVTVEDAPMLTGLPELGPEIARALAGAGIRDRHRLRIVLAADSGVDLDRLCRLPGVTRRRLDLWRRALQK